MARWTEKRVVELAPDDSSVNAARRLLEPGAVVRDREHRDPGLGQVPGQRQDARTRSASTWPGRRSGARARAGSSRASTPWRCFCCGCAAAARVGVADVAQAAGFAQEWADERAQRSDSRRPVRPGPTPPRDPAAQAKRLEERLALMTAGLEDFGRWLCDLVRSRHRRRAAAAVLLVGRHRRPARRRPASGPRRAGPRHGLGDPPPRRLGRPPARRSAAGGGPRRGPGRAATRSTATRWPTSGPSSAGPSRRPTSRRPTASRGPDLVLGGHRTDDGRLQQQRTWLRDESTGRDAVVLDFAAGLTPLATPSWPGPSCSDHRQPLPRHGRRAGAVRRRPVVTGTHRGVCRRAVTIAAAQSREGRAPRRHARGSDRVPGGARRGRRDGHGDARRSHDAAGDRLDLVDDDASLWSVLAMTGGQPADMFGELAGGRVPSADRRRRRRTGRPVSAHGRAGSTPGGTGCWPHRWSARPAGRSRRCPTWASARA